MTLYTTFLQGLGVAAWATIWWKLTTFASIYISPSSLPKYHHDEVGSTWALVTGATDGIGYGFAEGLCSQGFNVLLHGRNKEKLANIKRTLGEKYPDVQIQTVVANAFDYNNVAIDEIVKVARALPGKLTVLVNNVGGQPLERGFEAVSEIDQVYMDSLINLNLRFPAQLTRGLLPLLIENSPSLIMNMTSATALRGLPYLSVYSPSKAFNYTFSESLRTEMIADGHDVEVLGIITGNVTSSTNKVHMPAITCDSAYMAKQALSRVGCGKANVWGWYRHGLQYAATASLPEKWLDSFILAEIKKRKAEAEKGQ